MHLANLDDGKIYESRPPGEATYFCPEDFVLLEDLRLVLVRATIHNFATKLI